MEDGAIPLDTGNCILGSTSQPTRRRPYLGNLSGYVTSPPVETQSTTGAVFATNIYARAIVGQAMLHSLSQAF